MTGVEIILLLTGVVFMVGSFFVAEKLSPSELNKIAELSEDELKKIIDRSIADAGVKIEEAIEKGRGYYEFVATVDGKEVIFRFNRSAFRNSYTMSDLPKMQLTYYAIHVGQIEKSDLQVQKEFEFGTAKSSKRVDYASASQGDSMTTEIEVYDVVFDGVLES